MALIYCSNASGSVVGWRDENNTAGLYKMHNNGSAVGWHLNQDAGWYLFNDNGSIGWRNKSFNTQLGSMPIGSIVKLKINNVDKEFIVVQHGKPAAWYDATFDGGTILLSNYLESYQHWGTVRASSGHTVLGYWGGVGFELTFPSFSQFDPAIVAKIKSVELMSGYAFSDNTSGQQNMSHTLFLPSIKEVGFTDGEINNHNSGARPNDGERWAYFQPGVSKLTGAWWTRTPTYHTADSALKIYVVFNGAINSHFTSVSQTFRYAFVLPQTILVDESGFISG